MIDTYQPPFEQEAERLVLTAMLQDECLIPTVAAMLPAGDFFDEAHGAIAAALYAVAQDGDIEGNVPLVKLKHELERTAQLEGVGGGEYLALLMSDYPDRANVEYNASAVHKASILRQLYSLAGEMKVAAGRATVDETDDLTGEFQDKLSALDGKVAAADSLVELGPVMAAAVARADKVHAGELSAGLLTGFGHVDKMTGGMQGGDLWVVGAATSIGKTSSALAAAANVARAGGSVLYASLEMNKREISNRLLSAEASIEGRRLREGNLNEAELESRNAAQDMMRGWSFAIRDKVRTVSEIAVRARQQAAIWRAPLDLIVVDHLQLIGPQPGGKRETRAQEVGAIAGALKALAMALSTPILVLSQLRRTEGTGPPGIHDLKESGDIENAASVVLLLHRPVTDEPDTTGRTILWGRVAKARDGQVTPWPSNDNDGIKFAFRAEYTRMEPLTTGTMVQL